MTPLHRVSLAPLARPGSPLGVQFMNTALVAAPSMHILIMYVSKQASASACVGWKETRVLSMGGVAERSNYSSQAFFFHKNKDMARKKTRR